MRNCCAPGTRERAAAGTLARRLHGSSTFRTVVLFALALAGIVLAHHWLVQWYAQACVPSVFQTAFSLGSPVCQFANTVQYALARQYAYTWGAGGAALCAFLITSAGCWEKRRGDEPSAVVGGAVGTLRLALEDDPADATGSDASLVRALVDQLVAWRLQHAGLTIDRPKLSLMLLRNDNTGAEKSGDDEDEDGVGYDASYDADAAASRKVGESTLSATAAMAPCFLWSRQHNDEEPLFFDLNMAGNDDDIPVEEVFYNADDGATVGDAYDMEDE